MTEKENKQEAYKRSAESVRLNNGLPFGLALLETYNKSFFGLF